jgi:ParB family chromosome partitioning protein
MPAKNRPPVKSLFPGLERRAEEARQRESTANQTTDAEIPASGRGRRAVLRTQEEINRDLRALPEGEREAVLSSTHLVADTEGLRDQIRYVDITAIESNPAQPRKRFDPAKLEELADSIRAQGVLSPIHVQALPDGRYRIIAGERRWRAARKAGRTNVPVIIKAVDDRQALELALLENLQREDLSPLEEAQTYRAMMQTFGLTQVEIGARIGKKQAYISKMLALLELPAGVQALMDTEASSGDNIPRGITPSAPLSAGAAYVLGRLPDPAAQEALARRVVEEGLSVRAVEALVRDWPGVSASPAPITDENEQESDEPQPETEKVVAPTPQPARRAPTVYPTTFSRPAPAGPQVRFADLSVFQLYREVGRITTVDLARLEDAIRADLAMLEVLRANAEATEVMEKTHGSEAI